MVWWVLGSWEGERYGEGNRAEYQQHGCVLFQARVKNGWNKLRHYERTLPRGVGRPVEARVTMGQVSLLLIVSLGCDRGLSGW